MYQSSKINNIKRTVCTVLIAAALLALAGCKSPWGRPNNVEYCTVSFVSAGGSAVDSQRVVKGSTAVRPVNPAPI